MQLGHAGVNRVDSKELIKALNSATDHHITLNVSLPPFHPSSTALVRSVAPVLISRSRSGNLLSITKVRASTDKIDLTQTTSRTRPAMFSQRKTSPIPFVQT